MPIAPRRLGVGWFTPVLLTGAVLLGSAGARATACRRECSRRGGRLAAGPRVLREAGPAALGRALPEVPLGGCPQGQPAAPVAGRSDGGRRYRPGDRARRPERKPAGRRHQLWRDVPDAPQVENAARRNRGADAVGRVGGSLAGRAGGDENREGQIRSGRAAGRPLGLAADPADRSACSAKRRLAAKPGRSVRTGPARSRGAIARAGGRQADAPAAAVFRSDRPAAHSGRRAGVSGRPVARCGRKGRRSAARVAAVRRALGPPLARPGALRRIAWA